MIYVCAGCRPTVEVRDNRGAEQGRKLGLGVHTSYNGQADA